MSSTVPAADQIPLLRTDDLVKTYGATSVVNHLSLSVPSGGIYGFLGPNGAGKSTTMKMMLGLVKPTSGHIQYRGQDLATCRASVLPSIGSLIEGPSYYPNLTGRENLRLAAESLGTPTNQVQDCLDTVELGPNADKLAKHYSMGMKQRLGIAMALLGDPFLLMLDEPTNGLDPAGVVEIRELIIRLARGRGMTVVVSSHILSEIEQMADTVGIIRAGQLRYEGPLDGLRDAGTLVIRTSDAEGAEALMRGRGLGVTRVGAEVRTTAQSDAVVAGLVRDLAASGHEIYRVELRRRSLEEAFLRLTEDDGQGVTA